MSEDDGKTEVEFAGVKFRGGKIFVIITALSTLGGGLYAGFVLERLHGHERKDRDLCSTRPIRVR